MVSILSESSLMLLSCVTCFSFREIFSKFPVKQSVRILKIGVNVFQLACPLVGAQEPVIQVVIGGDKVTFLC